MRADQGVTRRLLLTAGGLSLLGGCSTAAQQAVGARHVPDPRPAGASRLATVGPSGGHRPGQGGTITGAIRPMYYVHDGPMAIALTIDDGPSPIYTPQILRLLARYHITASFSMIGIDVDRYPAVARDVAAAGHTITNHTWQHLDLSALPATAALAQIDRATEAINQVTGRIPAFFRAPYGAWSRPVLLHCKNTGMSPIDWSVDPRDWARPGVPYIADTILRNTRTGSIILGHDGGGDRSQTVAALKMVIPRLLDAGYHFRTP